MRIGFLGVGRIGASHAAVVARHEAVTSLVVADADSARARAVADELGAESVADVAAVLAAGVDAIVVATATDSHAELIAAGARAGVPVFCEKPVALDVAGTLRVLDEVARRGHSGADRLPTQVRRGLCRRA